MSHKLTTLINKIINDLNVNPYDFTIEDCKMVLNKSSQLKEFLLKELKEPIKRKFLETIDNDFLITIIEIYIDYGVESIFKENASKYSLSNCMLQISVCLRP